MQIGTEALLDSSAKVSDALVRRVFGNINQTGQPPTGTTREKAPIGVARMDARGIVVLELRLTDSRTSRQAPPMHYWPGMPDYQHIVNHVGLNPGQTRFVYPFP